MNSLGSQLNASFYRIHQKVLNSDTVVFEKLQIFARTHTQVRQFKIIQNTEDIKLDNRIFWLNIKIFFAKLTILCTY